LEQLTSACGSAFDVLIARARSAFASGQRNGAPLAACERGAQQSACGYPIDRRAAPRSQGDHEAASYLESTIEWCVAESLGFEAPKYAIERRFVQSHHGLDMFGIKPAREPPAQLSECSRLSGAECTRRRGRNVYDEADLVGQDAEHALADSSEGRSPTQALGQRPQDALGLRAIEAGKRD
jgi:hypothetical protein